MASIARDPGGRRRILFVAPDGSRKTIRLGKVPQRTAEAVKVKVEALVVASITNQAPDDETARWVAGLGDELADRLASVGLIPKRAVATLGAFIDEYVGCRVDVKGATAVTYRQTRRNLIDYLGADKPLREITQGDADGFRLHLVGEGLAENTVRRRCGIAKQFLRAAERRGLVHRNAFSDLVSAVQATPNRLRFITPQDTARILEACPDRNWRLIVALARLRRVALPERSPFTDLAGRGLGGRANQGDQPENRTLCGQGIPLDTAVPRAAPGPGRGVRGSPRGRGVRSR